MRRAQRAIFPSRAWFGVVAFVSSEGPVPKAGGFEVFGTSQQT